MTYTAEQLERQFRNLGGNHSLKEDCQTLTGSFNKLESLREIKEELKKCTNKSEYDAKKGNYIRKCEESLRGLQEKSASSSMFGDDGKKLKANVKKQQELSNKFNFDPNKRIDDLIESIKQAIENNRGSGSGGSGSGRNRNKKNDNDGDDEDDNGSNNTGGDGSDPDSRKNDKKENPLQGNQRLIIFGSVALGLLLIALTTLLIVSIYYLTKKEHPEPRELTDAEQKEEKSKEQLQYLVIMLLIGMGYYLFFFLPEQRNEARKEIEEIFRENSPVAVADLDAKRLDKLYLPTQISKFSENIREAIETRKKEIEAGKAKNLKEARENAINSIKKFAEMEIKKTPSFEKDVKKFYKRINNASENDISSIVDEANKLNGLVNPHNEPEKEPNKCNFAASYKINFPPSLWSELTEEQKVHERAEELKLRDEVDTLIDPVRGERDKSNTDNNATLYGAPRTGKSIIVEKLAYKADSYPLVVIQGSALTPTINDQKCGINNFKKFIYTICDINNTLVDDFDFERNYESGEPRYIFFIDEANQVSENTFVTKSSGLTFLKECMGTVYQPGRLANRLCFSWTLGKFKEYSSNAGIIDKFINNEDNKKILNEEKETDEKGEETIKQKDTDFDGKFTDPREPKIQDVVIQASNHISKALDTRLKTLDETIATIKEEVQVANNVFNENFNNAVEQITGLLSEIGGNMKRIKAVCWCVTVFGAGYVCKKGHDAYKHGQKTKREKEEELRGKLGFLQTQLDDLKGQNKSYRDERKRNDEQRKKNNETISNIGSNTDEKH
ncbi:817_t:CDS:10 [Entrophospora sp. SA101]|nr:817_t:CDS:10 [Entrophospora sp. SA101]